MFTSVALVVRVVENPDRVGVTEKLFDAESSEEALAPVLVGDELGEPEKLKVRDCETVGVPIGTVAVSEGDLGDTL